MPTLTPCAVEGGIHAHPDSPCAVEGGLYAQPHSPCTVDCGLYAQPVLRPHVVHTGGFGTKPALGCPRLSQTPFPPASSTPCLCLVHLGCQEEFREAEP